MLYPENLSEKFIEALYAEAERLLLLWVNADLSLDFADRMIEAVLRFAVRNKLKLDATDGRRLLVAFWLRNAKRDYARSRSKPRTVPLDQVQVAVQPECVQEHYELFSRCRSALVEAGIRPEIAEAFLQDACHDKTEDVIRTVEVQTGLRITPGALRQWRRRHFRDVARYLRTCDDVALEAA